MLAHIMHLLVENENVCFEKTFSFVRKNNKVLIILKINLNVEYFLLIIEKGTIVPVTKLFMNNILYV